MTEEKSILNEDDDFFGCDGDEMKVDERFREKCFEHLRKSGYRDGIQAHMNDEQLIQRAFNYAFSFNTKIAFLFGYLRAVVQNGTSQPESRTFVAKLDSIETDFFDNFDYKSEIRLHDDIGTSLIINEDALRVHLHEIVQRLAQFKEEILSSHELRDAWLNKLIDELMSKIVKVKIDRNGQ